MIQKNFALIRIFFITVATVLLISAKLCTNKFLFYLPLLALVVSGSIGIAHGALDWSLAKLWGLRSTARESVLFALVYVGCIAVTLIFWQLFPSLALLIFLLMSLVHFAHDWQKELRLRDSYLIGIAIICLPTINFHNEVRTIFELLLSGSDARLLTFFMYYMAIFSSFALGLTLIRLLLIGKHSWIVVEVVFLMLIGIYLTPIVYFSIYFCFLHAPKHWVSMRVIGLYTKLSQGIYSALWPTLSCMLLGILAVYYCSDINFNDALCKTVFIGLAALTVPHWLLLEIYSYRATSKINSHAVPNTHG